MNTAFGLTHFIYLGLVLTNLVLAALLLRRGLRPRRRGTTPHCAKCGYNLTALTSDRCPECGVTLTADNIVHGEPYQRPIRIVLGLVLLVGAGVILLALSRQVNWYQLRPTGWLINDLSSTNAPDARRAWTELDRRYLARRLSAGQNNRLIDVALQEQAKATPGPLMGSLVDHLGRACLAGQMSAAQQETFVTQAFSATLQARPTTILGRRTPVRVSHVDRGPSQALWLAYETSNFSVDDQKPESQGSMSGCTNGSGGRGSFSTGVHIKTAGRHRLNATVRVELWNGPFANKTGGVLIDSADIPLTTETEVLAAEPAGYIQHASGPALDALVRASLEPKHLKLKLKPEMDVELVVGVKSPPVDVAMDAFIRVDGREYKVGTINSVAGSTTDWHVEQEWRDPGDEKPATFASCDVILRSSDEVARGTVELFEIWEGELIYKDVPVELETPATQPTQPAHGEEATP